MQVISEEYLALNRELHRRGLYGSGGFRWSDHVAALKNDAGCDTVLDYGCGNGTLGTMLGSPDWLREYDPAIDGKDAPPAEADMVVCTDVLEHVEPEFLDAVLTRIANLSRRITFMTISTVPADKVLADGRNAHINLHDARWWRAKLDNFFDIAQWNDPGHELMIVASPLREITEMIARSAVSDTLRFEQALMSCARIKERVPRDVARHGGRVAIVCYGPSLKDTWRNVLIERKMFGSTIVTVSGAHDFLIERGIVPDVHIECDPREHKAFFTRNPHPDVTYWIASCCHPKMFDQLAGQNLALWHVYNSEMDLNIIAPGGPDPGNALIAGVGTVGGRAVNLMFTQGYRSFAIFGMDCSFETVDQRSGEQHAGAHSGKPMTGLKVRFDNRWFHTSGGLAYTAKAFLENMRILSRHCQYLDEPKIEGTNVWVQMFMYGDGLLQAMAQDQTETALRAAQAA